MSARLPRHHSLAVGAVLGVLVLTGATATPATAASASAAVTITAPAAGAALTAGTTDFAGSTSAGPGAQTSVMFVLDTSGSTGDVTGQDCNADGAVSAADPSAAGDDLNRDGVVGDTLDCEIGAVVALNRGLAALPAGTAQVGLTGFAATAATASFSADATTTFVTPTALADTGAPALDVVAGSVTRRTIGLYRHADLGHGTDFDQAIGTALRALATAPAGPKWLVFLSDGLAHVSSSTLTSVTGSGVRLRSFGIGPDGSCATSGSLAKLAAASGEQCVRVRSAAELTDLAVATSPASVARVDLAVGGRTVPATLDPFGNWSAHLTLLPGSYTATVTATSSTGTVSTARRNLTVKAPKPVAVVPSHPLPPAAPLPVLVPQLSVAVPAPTTAVAAPRVTGWATLRDPAHRGSLAIDGLSVNLQAGVASGPHHRVVWRQVGVATVHGSRFTLSWRPVIGTSGLRVVLPAQQGLAAVVASVGVPPISACTMSHPRSSWITVCRTTAARGARATLGFGHVVLGRTTVTAGHSVRIVSARTPAGATLTVALGHGHTARVVLPRRTAR